MPEKKQSIKDKLQKDIAAGRVNVSSADIASAFDEEKKPEPLIDKPTTVPLAKEAKEDPLLKKADGNSLGQTISRASELSAEMSSSNAALKTPNLMAEMISITPEDKSMFLDALITGKRFELRCTIFNTLPVTIRSRTQAESYAIIAIINKEIKDGKIDNNYSYSTRLRNLLFAAQVAMLGPEEYPCMKEPLLYRNEGDKIIEPGWLAQAELWNNKPEALVTALYTELRKFENKYWTMTASADNQNFWNPAESTLV